MAANDLKKPLGQDKKQTSGLSHRFMLGSVATFGVVLAGLIGWITMVDDPNGGYPAAKIDLTATLRQTTKIGVEGMRPGIKPGIPETNLDNNAQSNEPDLFPNRTETDQQDPSASRDQIASNSGDGIRILDPSSPQLNSVNSGDSSQQPFKIFARPVNSDAIAGLPKIAIVVDGLGLSQTTTQEALSLLPPDVTLAFAPYGNSLARWTQKARSQGHELLVQVPMEPFDYPNNDPGPHTLLTAAKTEANKANLNWVLGRFDSYVGVMNYMGARFSADELAGTDFMREMQSNGLLYLESGASGRSRLNAIASNMNVPNLKADLVLDFQGREADIETRLIQLETIAQENGYALGIASAFPTSVRTISEWTQSLRQRGFALVPLTTLLRQ